MMREEIFTFESSINW